MTRRLAAATSVVSPPPDPVDPVDPDPDPVDPLDAAPGTLPYAMRTSAPWNSPTYAITPTPDGTGSAVHPDVIDFGPGNLWNGWRFWMGVTPYFNGDGAKENPLILVSSDGFTWQTPTGEAPQYLALPIQPGGIQSDTDLVFDPDGNRLILTWREYNQDVPATEWIYGSESADGQTWAPRTLLWQVTGGAEDSASQALVRVGPNDWRAWARNKPVGTDGGLVIRTATNPLGTWSAPAQCVLPATGGDGRFWHLDVIRHEGRFLGLFSYVSNWAAYSTDGITWTSGPGRMITAIRPGQWDSINMYRGSMQPHVDGEHMRVWYSAEGGSSWRVAYTIVPMSFWAPA